MGSIEHEGIDGIAHSLHFDTAEDRRRARACLNRVLRDEENVIFPDTDIAIQMLFFLRKLGYVVEEYNSGPREIGWYVEKRPPEK